VKMLETLGKGEGEVDLIAWAGYVEDGSTDPNVDWVTDFENQTGCQVKVKVGNTSDEMVTLMRNGSYDGVSASGDATLRLIAGGDVAPVNTDLVPNYKDVFDALKDRDFNSVDGQMYGIPHGRGANLLMWRKDKIPGSLRSWDAVFDPAQMAAYKGKVTAYDNPIYIADAALWLKAHQKDLGITNPYELDDKQFTAAVNVLKEQRKYIGEYWSDYTKEQSAFSQGDSVVGTTWQVIANLLESEKNPVPIGTVLPKEGSTGWSDTWMIAAKAKHPNCMYMWMNHIISPKANAQVAEWFGEAPANRKSCALTENKDHCKVFHAEDESYFDKIAFWTTPTKQCGDDRGAVCKDYSEWVNAWTEIKG
jgi:putative spermidine/putrescine transport system substrate-binding protein